MSFQKTTRLLLLLLALISLLSFPGFGQQKNFSIATTFPSWIVRVDPSGPKPKARDISDGYYIALYEQQVHAELKQTYFHLIRHLVSGSGVQNASEISVTYAPSYQKLVFHQLKVWRNGKATDRLKEADFKVLQNEKDLSKFIYNGTFDAYVILNDIRKDDKIEYAYSLIGTNPIFGDKVAEDFYHEGSSSYGKKYTNLIARADRKLDFRNYNHSTNPMITTKGDLKIYSWENKLTDTYKTADHEPSWYNPFKHTEISEYHTWADVVDWGLAVNDYPNLKTPLLDEKAKELLKQAGNDTEKYMVLAIRFVQDEIRYMGIEMGENSQKPNSPEKVLKQRYGDCKDKALLLCYLLKKVNVSAYMAYVDTYAGNKTSEFLPSPFLFNHVVVMIVYKGQKTWIDATISNQRGRFDSIYFPNYGQALVLMPGNNRPENVISIPTGGLSSFQYFTLADTVAEHKSKLRIVSTYTDQYADNIRQLIADDGAEALEKSFMDYIKGYYSDLLADGNIRIRDDESANQIVITENYLIPGIWQKLKDGNGRKYVEFQGDLITGELRKSKGKSRIAPFKMKYPANVQQHIFIKMPFKLTGGDEKQKIENDNQYFEFNSIHRGRELHLHYTYRTFKESIAGADLPEYAKDQEKITNLLNYSITWTGGSSNYGANSGNYISFHASVYWLPLSIFFFFVLASAFLFYKRYVSVGAFDINELIAAKSIDGWLILLGFQITLMPFAVLNKAIKMGVFMKAAPDLTTTIQIITSLSNVLLSMIYGLAFSASLFLIAFYYNKRKEFPKYFRAFSLMLIMVSVMEIIMIIGLTKAITGSYNHLSLFSSIFTIVTLGLWAVYFKKSRVPAQTFVFTFPEFAWRVKLIQHMNMRITKKFSKIDPVSESLPPVDKPDQTDERD